MFPIASVVSSGTGNISFTNIPQTYTHLQARITARNAASPNNNIWLNINGVYSAGSHFWHRIYGDGSGVASTGQSDIVCIIGYALGTSVSSTTYSSAIVDILDYTNTNKYKVAKTISGINNNDANNANQQVGLFSALRLSTDAVTRLDIGIGGDNFGAGTRVDLYGLQTSSVTGA